MTAGKTANLWHGALCGWSLREHWSSKALYLPRPKSLPMSGRELYFQPAMAFWDDLSAGGSREKVERKPEVSKVIYPEESYNLKKISVAMCQIV